MIIDLSNESTTSSEGESEVETIVNNQPNSVTLQAQHNLNSLSIVFHSVEKKFKGKTNSTNPSGKLHNSWFEHLTRRSLGNEFSALKLKIIEMQTEIQKLKTKNNDLIVKQHSKNIQQSIKMNELRQQLKKLQINWERSLQNRKELDKKIQELSGFRRDYFKLKEKCDQLNKKLKNPSIAPLQRSEDSESSGSDSEHPRNKTEIISISGDEEKEEKDDDEFERSLQAAIRASMAVNSPILQEKSDMRLEEEINFTMELSKKEDEIRKQREHALAIEQLFKSNLEAERAAKRKLKSMEFEKERTTKRLKVVEQEKEQLVDQLESTTLCGFCEEKKKDTAFEPCGHIWACEDCVKKSKMTNCPNCRSQIENVRKVFI